jgi:hypothetical protein
MGSESGGRTQSKEKTARARKAKKPSGKTAKEEPVPKKDEPAEAAAKS